MALFEKGNRAAAKSKLFDNTLRRAIAEDDGKKVRRCIDKLLTLAAQGEAWAVRELADRLDGKAAQMIEVHQSSDVQDMSKEEILERIAALRGSVTAGTAAQEGSSGKSSIVH